LLLQMLQQMQQRYDRLLEAPRSVSPSTAAAPEPGARLPRDDRRRPSPAAVPPPGAAPREGAPYNAAAAAARMPAVPEPAPPASLPPRHRGRPVSLLRQRILTLLQAHPEGLSVEELRVYLKPGKPIGDLLQGMRKGGVITARGRRPERRYVLA